MKIPKKIVVGSYTYTISFPEKIFATTKSGKKIALDGDVNFDDEKIQIKKSLRGPRRELTLWHELIHAIAEDQEMELSEEKTDKLAHGIVQILKDHPSLAPKPR